MNRLPFIVALALAAPFTGRAFGHPAWGIVVDRQGQVYFADIDHGNQIWKIDAAGKLLSVVSGRHSHDLSLDSEGNLYVAHVAYIRDGERWESRLLKVEPSGASTVVIAPTTDRKRFWGNAFAVDADGNVYFGYTNNPRAGEIKDESLLLKRGADGRVSVLAGGTRGRRDGTGREAQFSDVDGLAWGPHGVLYVADHDAIRKVTREGVVTTLARDLVARASALEPLVASSHLFGLAVAAHGAVYAADHSGRRILKVSPEGQVSAAAVSEGSWAPTGVAVTEEDLYILEVGSSRVGGSFGPRVRKVTADGKATILATVAK